MGNYSIFSSKVKNTFTAHRENNRNFMMILKNLGFDSTFISIKQDKRFEGSSSYNFSKLLRHGANSFISNSLNLPYKLFIFSNILFLIAIIILFTTLINPKLIISLLNQNLINPLIFLTSSLDKYL